MKKKTLSTILLLMIFISACSPISAAPTEVPGIIYTIVAATNDAAWTQTAAGWPTATLTPRATSTLRATPTPITPTATFIISTSTPRYTATPTATATLPPVYSWPAWDTGEVIKVSGLGGGVFKLFPSLVNIDVVVVRQNGVKLRSVPSKAIGGPMAEYGSLLRLTGRMNKNNEFGWLFAEVKTSSGTLAWVGGDINGGNTNPTENLIFYNPG